MHGDSFRQQQDALHGILGSGGMVYRMSGGEQVEREPWHLAAVISKRDGSRTNGKFSWDWLREQASIPIDGASRVPSIWITEWGPGIQGGRKFECVLRGVTAKGMAKGWTKVQSPSRLETRVNAILPGWFQLVCHLGPLVSILKLWDLTVSPVQGGKDLYKLTKNATQV